MSVSSVYTHHAVALDGIDHKFQMVVHRLPKLSMRVNRFKIRVVSHCINPQNGRNGCEHKGFVWEFR